MNEPLSITQFCAILAYAGMSRLRVFGLRRLRWTVTRRPGRDR